MKIFELRNVCNEFLDELNQPQDKKNDVKLGIDVKLPAFYTGHANNLIRILRSLCIFITTLPVTVPIMIEITFRRKVQDCIILHVEVAGHCPSRDLDHHALSLYTGKLEPGIQCTVNDDAIRFEFIQMLQCAKIKKRYPDRRFQNKKILVVEDNEINAMVCSSLLEEWNCESTIAVNGEEAILLAQQKLYDAILMDINLPVLNGIQATKMIRKFDTKVPIIALTASSDEGEVMDAINAGANDYLVKPLNSYNTQQVLAKYLAKPNQVHIKKSKA